MLPLDVQQNLYCLSLANSRTKNRSFLEFNGKYSATYIGRRSPAKPMCRELSHFSCMCFLLNSLADDRNWILVWTLLNSVTIGLGDPCLPGRRYISRMFYAFTGFPMVAPILATMAVNSSADSHCLWLAEHCEFQSKTIVLVAADLVFLFQALKLSDYSPVSLSAVILPVR